MKTKAETMREIVERRYYHRIAQTKVAAIKFVRKVVDGKVRARAEKGCSTCRVMLKKKYNEFYVVSRLRDMGFKARTNCRNGKTELVIEW